MGHGLLLLMLAAMLGELALPSPASAFSVQGTFLFNAAKSDDINRAINKSVESMNFLIRPIARKQLLKNNEPPWRLTLEVTPTEVVITTDKDTPLHTPLAGTPVKLEDEDEDSVMMSTRFEGDVLVQTFKAPDGQRVNTYASPDGQTLTMDVRVSSAHLKIPVTYRLVYLRI